MERKGFFVSEKKGISVMIGYVLLVVFVIIIGGLVYQWLKTYVPTEALDCPEGVSLFVKEARFNTTSSQLNVTLRNNGRFNLAGYFIHATNSSDQELPTIDLSSYLNDTSPGMIFGNAVLFSGPGGNLFPSDSEEEYLFDLPDSIGDPYLIRITPTRFQDVEEKERFVSCSDSRASQIVGEPIVECVAEEISVTCEGLPECGQRVNNCGDWVQCPPGCVLPNVCEDSTGECMLPGLCNDDCTTPFNYVCGDQIICGEPLNCGTCDPGKECNGIGQCVLLCGNRIIDPGEECDDGDLDNNDGCSSTCQREVGWVCTGQPSTCVESGGSYGVDDYCIDLGVGYTTGTCVNNYGGCVNQNGELVPGGDGYCTDTLACCIPAGAITESIVFVSSEGDTYTGNFGGVSGADTNCNTLASAASLTGNFVAWLSDSITDAKDRLPTEIPFKRTDGVIIADNLADLLDGTIGNKINVDEAGVPPAGTEIHVFTGTKIDGTAKDGYLCEDWTIGSDTSNVWLGNMDKTDNKWTDEKSELCNHNSRIYCFQVS